MKILIVTVESLMPEIHGGRVRTGNIGKTFARAGFDVHVVFPMHPGAGDPDFVANLEQTGLDWSPPLSVLRRLAPAPWLGTYMLSRTRNLQQAIDVFDPDYVYWSHSYLASVGMSKVKTSARHVVEFANIERERFLSMSARGTLKSRLSAFLEYMKSLRWEQRTIQDADLCVAISPDDGSRIREYTDDVVVVENALSANSFVPSPNVGSILSVANWNYRPNREGIDSFLRDHWARVLMQRPDASLTLAGKGSDEVVLRHSHLPHLNAVGYVEDLSPLFASSAMFLAPARSGAGRQLKVAEALGNARIVVGPSFLSREHRVGLPEGALRANQDVAAEIVNVLADSKARWDVELRLASYANTHGWDFEARELINWMRGKAKS